MKKYDFDYKRILAERDDYVKYEEECSYGRCIVKRWLDEYGNTIRFEKSVYDITNPLLMSWCDSYGNEEKYDEKGNKIYLKDGSDGFEAWYEYDDYGNMICCRDNLGNVKYFDAEGNSTYTITGDDNEYGFDANGKISYWKKEDGTQIYYTRFDNGNIKSILRTRGKYECYREYDETTSEVIYETFSTRYENPPIEFNTTTIDKRKAK